jgi:hypothetical protein
MRTGGGRDRNAPKPFAVDVDRGDYTVTFLHLDRTTESRHVRTGDGRLTIAFPERGWSVSGLVIQGRNTLAPLAQPAEPRLLPRPAMRHEAPERWRAGQALTLRLKVGEAEEPRTVRLHYRPVNQLAAFKTLEAAPGETSFTVPGAEITPAADLVYYFELLHGDGGGWFLLDPLTTTPYYVVRVE